MNNNHLKPMAGASSIISVMSLEDLFNNSSRFNGPMFNSNALLWNVDSDDFPTCHNCDDDGGCLTWNK